MCSVVFEADEAYPFLRVGFDVIDKDREMTLLCIGAYFKNDQALFGQMHSQEYCLLNDSVVGKEEAFGTAAELGLSVARWIEGVLERPLVYREWSDLPSGRFREWAFADSQIGLIASGRGLPPHLEQPGIVDAVNIQ